VTLVARFALPTAQTFTLAGVGEFIDGILDVDANNLRLVTRARYLVKPYRAVDLGIVDSSTPKPVLPAAPVEPDPDPYPQYITTTELDTLDFSPAGQWDFAKTPTVAGVPIGTSGGTGGGTAPDATTTVKGIVKLSGDLGGTAESPTVPRLATMAAQSAVEAIKVHDGSAGGGTRPVGFARVRWVGGAARPTNMAVGDVWEHNA
jgi:hypothetical protein